jgi:hypothetical protein
MNFEGMIIEESLIDASILKKINISPKAKARTRKTNDGFVDNRLNIVRMLLAMLTSKIDLAYPK